MAKVKITEYGSDLCDPCKDMKTELAKLKKNHPKWSIKRVDINKAPKKYKNIDAIPLIKICANNKCKEIVGRMTKEEIEKMIDEI